MGILIEVERRCEVTIMRAFVPTMCGLAHVSVPCLTFLCLSDPFVLAPEVV
jgi:hypothetical protein